MVLRFLPYPPKITDGTFPFNWHCRLLKYNQFILQKWKVEGSIKSSLAKHCFFIVFLIFNAGIIIHWGLACLINLETVTIFDSMVIKQAFFYVSSTKLYHKPNSNGSLKHLTRKEDIIWLCMTKKQIPFVEWFTLFIILNQLPLHLLFYNGLTSPFL